jgi:hypothetical protein
MQSVTQRAIAAVGSSAPSDWELKPDRDAAMLGSEAEPLKLILQDPHVSAIMAVYREGDAAAGRAQRLYKRLARTAAWTGFGAMLIGSLVLMFALAFPLGLALTVAAVAQGVLLLVSLGSSLLVGSWQPFATWMQCRAEAETARIGFFDRVMTASPQASPGGVPPLPLQLEYFRRYQLQVQQLYYETRASQHAAAARAAWWWRLIAFVLVVAAAFPVIWLIRDAAWLPAFVGGVAEQLPGKSEAAQRIFLGLGIIAAALQGLLAALAAMSLDERNALRYRSTADNLDALAAAPLEEAREAAAVAATGPPSEADGAREMVLAFVALVQDQISTEHREWIALRKLAPDLSIGSLKSLRLPPRA